MRPPLLDTHAWIWYLGDQTKLTWTELNALDALDFENRPFISDFSLWEIATLISIKRLTLDRPLDRWLSIAARPTSVRILAVSVSVAIELAELPEAFHREPPIGDLATARAMVYVLTVIAKSSTPGSWKYGHQNESLRSFCCSSPSRGWSRLWHVVAVRECGFHFRKTCQLLMIFAMETQSPRKRLSDPCLGHDHLSRALGRASPVGGTEIQKNRFDTTQEVRPGPGTFPGAQPP